MVTVTPSMTPTFLTFDFQVSLLIHQLLVPVKIWSLQTTKKTQTGLNEPRNYSSRSNWTWLPGRIRRVVTCCDPSKTCLSESHSARCLSLFFRGAKFRCIKKWGFPSMLAAGCFLHPKKRDALGFRNWKNGSWTFRPCTQKGFLTNLPLGCSSTSVGHQQTLTIVTKPQESHEMIKKDFKGLTWLKSIHQHPTEFQQSYNINRL